MSSTYRIICLSHDPGIVIDHDWASAYDGHLAAPAVAAKPGGHPATAGHVDCDLMVGRYSTPLIEVCCPGHTDQYGSVGHSSPEWIDVAWLRLLWLAHQEPAGSRLKEAAEDHRLAPCWTFDRVHRLRDVLDLGGDR